MIFFLQTPITEKPHFEKSLQAMYGIGEPASQLTLKIHGLLDNVRGKELRRFHKISLKRHFKQFPRMLTKDLKQFYISSCQRLINNQSYRGFRHKLGYPVRGQRTHTNASIQKRLHKRWLIKTYKKTTKVSAKTKKAKAKKLITKKPAPKKPATKLAKKKQQPATPKQSKYKV